MNYFLDGLNNLLSSRLRSLLALTGILIGTCAVVAMITGGRLATDAALSQFRSMGTDLLDISILALNEKDSSQKSQALQLKDLNQLILQNSAIKTIAPYTLSYRPIRYHNHPIQGTVFGVTHDFQKLMKTHTVKGRELSSLDTHEFLCVIGSGIAAKIRQSSLENPLSHYIQFGQSLCKIIGILQPWPESFFLPANLDDAILLPIQTAHIADHTTQIRNIIIQIATGQDIVVTGNNIEQQLQQRFPNQKIFVRSPKELMTRIQRQSDILTVFLGLTGSITLFVGGIGIMNIMLVSVIERRREIGIRLALGATPRDIRQLFLAESILLTLSGGIPGILLGLLLARLVSYVWHWPFHFFILPPLAGFTVATLTGIIAGLYPATLAAKLDPVESLRAN